MKKVLPVLIVVGVIAAIIAVRMLRQPAIEPETAKNEIVTGEPILFELTWRGVSGGEDDLRIYGGPGYKAPEDQTSPFLDAVRQKVTGDLQVVYNATLPARSFSMLELRDDLAQHFYFDVNADGQLSDDECFSPIEVASLQSVENTVVFATPEFVSDGRDGKPEPVKYFVTARMISGRSTPYVRWAWGGVYEGSGMTGDQAMRFYLLPSYNGQGYTQFSKGMYALLPESADQLKLLPRGTLSSLIIHEGTFYRLSFKPTDDPKKLTAYLAEDKCPRGKMDLKIAGNEGFSYKLRHVGIIGAADETIIFDVDNRAMEVPVGEYGISYGYFNYGTGEAIDYMTSIKNVSAFTLKADQTTVVQLGEPKVKLEAVELEKRYAKDRKSMTTFTEGTSIYLNTGFVGTAGETYGSFRKYETIESRRRSMTLKGRIKIADAQGNEVVNQELEYG